MTYEEFEWHILRLVYEDGLDRLQPSYLAYALGLPHETVSSYLDHATQVGLLELEVSEDGRLEYAIPGVDREKPLPAPLWKDEVAPRAKAELAPEPEAEEPADGSLHGSRQLQAPPQAPSQRAFKRPAMNQSQLPSTLRAHIEQRYAGADGSIVEVRQASPVVELGTEVEAANRRALVPAGHGNLPFRVESSDDAFCDPSQTVFMRQIRVYGVESEAALRDSVQNLFESFGYRVVQHGEDRVRFERGSVTFILALVPLFVLVLPLFVYLFLYCMGRSTIHQEPVELDVQFRAHDGPEPYYEIDMTFIGLHGVVLGSADQRVLNQEVDTLREELRWSLSS